MFKIQLLLTVSIINLKKLVKNRLNHSEEIFGKRNGGIL